MTNLTLQQFVAHKAQNPKTKNDFLYQEDRANGIADKWVRRQFAKAIKPQVGQQFKMTHTQTKFDFVYEITAIENKEYTFTLISEGEYYYTFTLENGKEAKHVFTFPAEFKDSCTYGKFSGFFGPEDYYVSWIPCTQSWVEVESGKSLTQDQDPHCDAYQLVLCEEEVITVDSEEEVVDSEEEVVDSEAMLFSKLFTPSKKIVDEYRKLVSLPKSGSPRYRTLNNYDYV